MKKLVVALLLALTLAAAVFAAKQTDPGKALVTDLNEVVKRVYMKGFIDGWKAREAKFYKDQIEFEKRHS